MYITPASHELFLEVLRFLQRQGPFQVFASHGLVIILPPSMIDEIRDDDRLSFLKSSQTVCRKHLSIKRILLLTLPGLAFLE